LTEIENMRLYNHFGQINAPKSNDKVEINAGNYTIYLAVMVERQCKPLTIVLRRTDKMPTLRKIKRAASRHKSQRFCSTFNFAQPHLNTSDCC